MSRTLVLFAHPYFEHSKANLRLIQAYEGLSSVTFRDLYQEYPDFQIQPFRERKRLIMYDSFIFHMPLLWFGMPPLLKLWMDETFDIKWISERRSESPLVGKKASIVVTAGGSKSAFSEEGLFQINAKKYLSPLTESLRILGVRVENFIEIYNADQMSYMSLEPYYLELRSLAIND